MKKKAALLLVLMSTSVSGKVQAADERYWIVRSDKFACILQNLETYRSANKSKARAVIFPEDCPDADLVTSLMRRSRNSVLPSVEKKAQDDNKPAEVVSFRTSDLACLPKLNIQTKGEFVRVPRNPCEEPE